MHPHMGPQYVRRSGRNRIDRRSDGIERTPRLVQVMDEDAFGDSNAIGQSVLPLGPNNLLTLRSGWRSVPLYSIHGDPLELSST